MYAAFHQSCSRSVLAALPMIRAIRAVDLLAMGILFLPLATNSESVRLRDALNVGAVLAVVGYLFGRMRLYTELACLAGWTAVLTGVYLLPAITGHWADRPDWDSTWDQGLLLVKFIPGAASMLAFALRYRLESHITTAPTAVPPARESNDPILRASRHTATSACQSR